MPPRRNYNSGHYRDLKEWCSDVGGELESDFDREVFTCETEGGYVRFSPTKDYNSSSVDNIVQRFSIETPQGGGSVNDVFRTNVNGESLRLRGRDGEDINVTPVQKTVLEIEDN